MPGSPGTPPFRIMGALGKSTTEVMLRAILAGSSARAASKVAIVLSAGTDDAGTPWNEIVAELGGSDTAVLTADDPAVFAARRSASATVVTFGLTASADFRAESVDATLDGTSFILDTRGERRDVQLRILGEHQVVNALAALAAAESLGISLRDAVAALEELPVIGRWTMEALPAAGGILIINDAISATPQSTAAALKTLALTAVGGRRSVAVLGELDTREDDHLEAHDRIGRLVVRLNVHKLVVVGHGARHIHNAAGLEGSWDGESVLVDSPQEAYDLLREELRTGDVVLVKSSGQAGLGSLGDRLAGGCS